MVNVRDATNVALDAAILTASGAVAGDSVSVVSNAFIATAYHYALKDQTRKFAAGNEMMQLGLRAAAFGALSALYKMGEGRSIQSSMKAVFVEMAAMGAAGYLEPMVEDAVGVPSA